VPSWEEPFGRVVVEALASGVPVAATRVGGPAEIFTHGEEGLLLPPRRPELWADEVGRLLGRPELRLKMGRRGRARAADFGLEAHVEAIRRVYDDVLSSSGRLPLVRPASTRRRWSFLHRGRRHA
jgi:glycosyltransferase involved in cell wall biosynthesis